ncbi:MAG TPA: tRNA(His) guanylyltransferase Thg1 family protein [Candidatus Sericytochromatia bacterium]|jgi:tRNA(His) 5'-end guanylyltransferase
MDSDEFEQQMRSLEYFHSLRLLPGTWVVVRVDGRGFSQFTKSRFQKPFDVEFHKLMVQTASALLEELHGIYAYTESDEISVLFPPTWDLFDRSLEKIVSLSASIASATFTHTSGIIVNFDSRVWLGVNESQVVDYFRWRQADATRCALNGWSYWTLRKLGETARKATQLLDSQSVAFKNELLFQNGINFNELPIWQRRGVGLYWEEYEKLGYNPVLEKEVIVKRRQIKVDEELPMKDEYGEFIRRFLKVE